LAAIAAHRRRQIADGVADERHRTVDVVGDHNLADFALGAGPAVGIQEFDAELVRHDVVVVRIVRTAAGNHAGLGTGIGGGDAGIRKRLGNAGFLARLEQLRHAHQPLQPGNRLSTLF